MPPKRRRCGECENCKFIADALASVPAKRRRKEQNKLAINRPCSEIEPKAKRKREADLLSAPVVGGQFRGNDAPVLPAQPMAEDQSRSARPGPGSMKEASHDEHFFKKYSDLVSNCTATAAVKGATVEDIAKESVEILKKMKSLLDIDVRDEIDFEEALRESAHIFLSWSAGKAAGDRAFIPSIDDRDEMVSTLEMYASALEEREEISGEWVAEFGDMGLDVYNDVLSRVAAEERMNVPLVNKFLKAFLRKLRDEEEDFTFYDMEQWLAEEMAAGEDEPSPACSSSCDLVSRYFGCAPPKQSDATGLSSCHTLELRR